MRFWMLWYLAGYSVFSFSPWNFSRRVNRCSSLPLNPISQSGPLTRSAGFTLPSPRISASDSKTYLEDRELKLKKPISSYLSP